jgi:hypothetical protein
MFRRSFAALLLSGIALAISSAFAFRSLLAMSSRTVPAPPSTVAQVELPQATSAVPALRQRMTVVKNWGTGSARSTLRELPPRRTICW